MTSRRTCWPWGDPRRPRPEPRHGPLRRRGVRHLGGEDFAAVLLDIQMPGLDGFETAKLIRGRERGGRTPILFVTAHEGDRAWVEHAYALGAVDYLVKPLIPVIVRAKVAGFVELFEKTREVVRQAEELRRWDRLGFEERLAEEAARLRRSEGRFRTMADSIPQLAWMTRPDGHFEWYNRRWYEYTGSTFEEMEGWGWRAVHDPSELPRVMDKWKAALAAGEPWEDTFPLRRHDGADAMAPLPAPARLRRRRPGLGLVRHQHRHRGSSAGGRGPARGEGPGRGRHPGEGRLPGRPQPRAADPADARSWRRPGAGSRCRPDRPNYGTTSA